MVYTEQHWADRFYESSAYQDWMVEQGIDQLPLYDYTDPEPYPEHLDPTSLKSWLQQFTSIGAIRKYMASITDIHGTPVGVSVPKYPKAAVLLELDSSEAMTFNFVEQEHNPDAPLVSIDDAIKVLDLAMFDQIRNFTGTWLHEQRARRIYTLPEQLSNEQVCLLGLFMIADRGWGQIEPEVLFEGMWDILQDLQTIQAVTLGRIPQLSDIPF